MLSCLAALHEKIVGVLVWSSLLSAIGISKHFEASLADEAEVRVWSMMHLACSKVILINMALNRAAVIGARVMPEIQ